MISGASGVSRRAVLGSALTLALTSCSVQSATGGGAVDQGGLTRVAVGLIPVLEVAPVYIGIRDGFFRRHGLDVTAQQFLSGPAVVPAVISGQVQFGFSNVISLLEARDKGVPLVSVAGAGTSTGNPERDINAVLVTRTSRLTSARDLVGKRVAINSWNNIGDTTIKTAVRKDGGDDWKIDFVQIPFAQMPAMLASGAVDAIWVAEPYRTKVLSSGGRLLFDNLTATYPKVQFVQYATTEQLKASQPALVTSFVNALSESMAYASATPRAVWSILPTYVKITPQVAASIVLPVWTTNLDFQSTLVLGTDAENYGTLAQAPDVTGLLGLG